MTLIERIEAPGPKRLLAIDGGGIRGVLALEVLAGIERLLASKSGRPDFRLAHYFDYIGGTSTGAIIAAGLSLGMSAAELLKFYEDAGPDMFVRSSWLERLRYKYESEPLRRKLEDVFGADTELGSDRLRTLLLLVLRNATTDSPWPISNNPYAKYNDEGREDCNLRFPLWQLVRGSTAAPVYFPPEVIVLQGKGGRVARDFVFVDGGVTMYNNPAFQMFLMATLDRYWYARPEARWKAGADRMLVVSVGTGTSPGAKRGLEPEDMHLLFNAGAVPSALMFAALNEQDLLCRVFGSCLAGPPLDREVGDLLASSGPLDAAGKLFTYLRYNAELTRDGLDALGCTRIEPAVVQKLDSIRGMKDLREVGRRVAETSVHEDHFRSFPAS